MRLYLIIIIIRHILKHVLIKHGNTLPSGYYELWILKTEGDSRANLFEFSSEV